MKLKFLLHDEVQQERRAYLRELVMWSFIVVLAAVGQIVWLSNTDTPPGSHDWMLEQLIVRFSYLGAVCCFGNGIFFLVQLISMGKWDT